MFPAFLPPFSIDTVQYIIDVARLFQNESGQGHAEQSKASKESQDLEREDDKPTMKINMLFHLAKK